MRYLIDTHTFLWFVSGNEEISKNAQILIQNRNNEIIISIASLWEISIKSNIGKLQINNTFHTLIDDVTNNNINILPIEFSHLIKNYELANYHKDPFDRIIISQAIAENIDVISRDNLFDVYLKDKSITRIW